MSDLEQLVHYIESTVGVQSNSATQKQCEQQLAQYVEADPNQFVVHLLNILRIRKFSLNTTTC